MPLALSELDGEWEGEWEVFVLREFDEEREGERVPLVLSELDGEWEGEREAFALKEFDDEWEGERDSLALSVGATPVTVDFPSGESEDCKDSLLSDVPVTP